MNSSKMSFHLQPPVSSLHPLLLRPLALAFTLFLLLHSPAPARANEAARQKLFQKVFGDAARLDPAMIKKALAVPGKRIYVDANHDGKPEEAWFIDLDARHAAADRPILVRAIDQDGDMRDGGEPDTDSDLYIADWKADGTVNSVVDYNDLDHDQKLDEMGIYFIGGAWKPGEDALMTWWSRDVGHDHKLWRDVSYTYRQRACQQLCDFNGDEMFASFRMRLADTAWSPWFENPFLFYDCDRDGVAEEAIRIEGLNEEVGNLRWSFDADNDAPPGGHDYDVSLSAWAPDGLKIDPALGESITLQGIPTRPFLKFDAARGWLRPITWKNMLLTWDENDINVDNQKPAEIFNNLSNLFERWEGIIAAGNEDFMQIGGPSCGIFNKRYELVRKPDGPVRLYFAPADQRLHLLGAERAWMLVDDHMDGDAEMRYTMEDANRDGMIDTWNLDLGADGTIEDTWTSQAPARMIGWDWAQVNDVMTPVLAYAPGQLYALNQALGQAVKKLDPQGYEEPVTSLIEEGFAEPPIPDLISSKLRASAEGQRFYFDILKDCLICRLKGLYKNAEFWKEFNELRGRGDLEGMRARVEREFTLNAPAKNYRGWKRRVSTKPQP